MVRTRQEVIEEVTKALEEVKASVKKDYPIVCEFQVEYDEDVLAVRWCVVLTFIDKTMKVSHQMYTEKMRLDPFWDTRIDFSQLVPKYKRFIEEAYNGTNSSNHT